MVMNHVLALTELEAQEQCSRLSSTSTRQVTRNRVCLSCYTCRRRKVKCNKARPKCSSCHKTGHRCIYDSDQKRPSLREPTTGGSGYQSRIETDVDSRIKGGKRKRTPNAAFNPSMETSECTDECNHTSGDDGNDYDHLEDECENYLGGDTIASQRLPSADIDSATKEDCFSQIICKRNNGSMRASSRGSEFSISPRTFMGLPYRAQSSAPKAWSRPALVLRGKTYPPAIGSPNWEIPAVRRGRLDRDPNILSPHFTTTAPTRRRNLDGLGFDRERSRYSSFSSLPSEEHLSCFTPSQDTTNDPPGFEVKATWPARHPASPDEFCHDSSFTEQRINTDQLLKGVVPKMLQDLPSKSQCNALYRWYISSVHPIMPILHPPSLLLEYHKFWQWLEDDSDRHFLLPDPTFVSLLYAIFYGGSVCCTVHQFRREFPQIARTTLSVQLGDRVKLCLHEVDFPRTPLLYSTIAFLIMQTVRTPEPQSGYLSASSALRAAQQLNLHRHPPQSGIDPYIAELRRRVWWHVLYMDTLSSTATQLPPLIDDRYCDIQNICEVQDRYLGAHEAVAYQQAVCSGAIEPDRPENPLDGQGPSLISLTYVVAQGRYWTTCRERTILDNLLNVTPMTNGDLTALHVHLRDIETRLKDRIRRIPVIDVSKTIVVPDNEDDSTQSNARTFGFLANPAARSYLESARTIMPLDDSDGESLSYLWSTWLAYHAWSRCDMALMIDKAHCFVYRALLERVRSETWSAMRRCALEYCHRFARKYIYMATEETFLPLRWNLARSHQPVHAIWIMLVDAVERPDSATTSRSKSFLGRIFSLHETEGGLGIDETDLLGQHLQDDGKDKACELLRYLQQMAKQGTEEDDDTSAINFSGSKEAILLHSRKDGSEKGQLNRLSPTLWRAPERDKTATSSKTVFGFQPDSAPRPDERTWKGRRVEDSTTSRRPTMYDDTEPDPFVSKKNTQPEGSPTTTLQQTLATHRTSPNEPMGGRKRLHHFRASEKPLQADSSSGRFNIESTSSSSSDSNVDALTTTWSCDEPPFHFVGPGPSPRATSTGAAPTNECFEWDKFEADLRTNDAWMDEWDEAGDFS